MDFFGANPADNILLINPDNPSGKQPIPQGPDPRNRKRDQSLQPANQRLQPGHPTVTEQVGHPPALLRGHDPQGTQ